MVLIINIPKLPPAPGNAKLSLTMGFPKLAGVRNVFFRIKDSLRNMQLRKGTKTELAENKKIS
ncbi:MAG: hypothetical protein D4R97_02795 [Bacteroidetes bacterium]|nr:MAG: hypothetical protein D4R97_02795 [Bacteroidota bacterium]